MHSGRTGMKFDKLQKRILITLLILCLVTPLGIIMPMFFNTGKAWGEWSAATIRDFIGYVPEGLARYSDAWKAPLPDYLSAAGNSMAHRSGFYIVSGIFGATLAFVIMLLISKLVIRNEK